MTRQGTLPIFILLFYSCLYSRWKTQKSWTWHLFREWDLHFCPDIVSIKGGLHFDESRHLYQNILSLQPRCWKVSQPSLFEIIKFLVCSLITHILIALHPVGFSLCSAWASAWAFRATGYSFIAPISLTHVQVQYWLTLSPDNISV